MVFVITRAFQSRKLFRVNQTTLRAVLNQKTCHPSAQAIQIQARFVCVYNSSRLPFIAVSNRYSRCLDRCLHESISIYYKTLKIYSFALKDFLCYRFWYFHPLPFLASMSGPQGPFNYSL